MSDPEPIEVNERAQAAVLVAQRVDGEFIPVRVASDGSLSTSGGGAGAATIVDQGAATTIGGAWPVELSDGTNVIGVAAHPVRVDPTGTTAQPVTASALPLPTGAAIEAKQDDGNASLASLDAKLPDQGQALRAASMPVVIAQDQTAIPVNASQSGTWTVAQGTPGASAWKVDGSAVTQPVSATSLPLPTNAAQDRTTAASPHAARLSDGTAFYIGVKRGDDVKADLRVGSADVSSSNPVPASLITTELAPPRVRLPQDGFGRTVTVEPTPVLQATFPYGCPGHLWSSYLTGTGTVTTTAASNSLATASTGASGSSVAELTSLSRWTYHAGQAMRLLFTTLFSAPSAGGMQAVGVGPYEGYAVGYSGTAFGLLHRRGGVAEVRTLTVTTKSTTAQTATVTLDGVAVSVAITNVGAGGTTVDTAQDIAAGDYSAAGPGWRAYQFGSTVIFVAKRTGSRTGTYSLTATTAVGTFARTVAGASPTDTWYAKTAWNGDRLDGSAGANNLSGMTLDATKIAVWQILIPYLGAGNVVLQAMDSATGQWTTCHTITGPNVLTAPILNNPTFNLWLYADGAANISASSASLALFCDGRTAPLGPRVAVGPTFKTTVGNASELPLLSIRVEPVYNGAPNRSGFVPLELVTSAQATGQVLLRAYLNATLTGANFGAVNAYSGLSFDTLATAASGGLLVSNIITSPSGGSTPFSLTDLNYKLEAGDVVTITAQQTTGTNATVAIALTGLEEVGTG